MRIVGCALVNTFMRVDVNLISAALLGIVNIIAYCRLDRSDTFNRLFFKGCQMILAMLLFETATCFLNRQPSVWLRWVSNVMHVFLFSVPPVLTYFWFLLAKTLTERASVREMKANKFHLIPVAVNGVIALLSPAFHWIFFIDNAGVYHRGPMYFVSLVISYSYLLIGFLMLIHRRKKLLRQEFQFLMLFCLMPMVGGLLQGLFYGPLLMWSCSACALIVMYLFLEERMVQTDNLTGAWTRASFEHYVNQLLQSGSVKPFGIIYADIDEFKAINDRFGHAEGDAAIQAFAEIVKRVLRKGDAFARMGGDEFAILANIDTLENLRAIAGRIELALEQYNTSSGKEYVLNCSIGADMFQQSVDLDVADLLRRVDRLMYLNKRIRKGES